MDLGDLRHNSTANLAKECPFVRIHGPRVFQDQVCWFDWRPGGASDTPMAVRADDGNMVLLPYVLDLCLEWLIKKDRFDTMSSDEKHDAKAAFAHLLHEVSKSFIGSRTYCTDARYLYLHLIKVDYCLLHQGSSESAAQVLAILMDFSEPSAASRSRVPVMLQTQDDSIPVMSQGSANRASFSNIQSNPTHHIPKAPLFERKRPRSPGRRRPRPRQRSRAPSFERKRPSQSEWRYSNHDNHPSYEQSSLFDSPRSSASFDRDRSEGHFYRSRRNANAITTKGDSYEDLEERPRQGRYKGETRHRPQQKDNKGDPTNSSIRRVRPLRAPSPREESSGEGFTGYDSGIVTDLARYQRQSHDTLRPQKEFFTESGNETERPHAETIKKANEQWQIVRPQYGEEHPRVIPRIYWEGEQVVAWGQLQRGESTGSEVEAEHEENKERAMIKYVEARKRRWLGNDEGYGKSRSYHVPTQRPERGLRRHQSWPSENLDLSQIRASRPLMLPAADDRPSSQIIRGQGTAADKGMRTMLILRAALYAALCALAADTSCVYETELGRWVVQVL